MGCILADSEAMSRRVEVAKALGMSLPPLINEFCGECGQWHTIQIPEEYCDQRFGAGVTTVDAPVKSEPDKYVDRRYCQTCHAYHNADNRCAGPRQVQNWEMKELG